MVEWEVIMRINKNIYIVSLQRNKRLRNYYAQHRIKGAKFLEISKKSDPKKILGGDLIFFLSSKDLSRDVRETISGMDSNWNLKIAVSTRKLRRLNDVCLTYIKACKDYKETHLFLKEIIECIAVPSLVGLDFVDIKQLFMMNSRFELGRYNTKLSEKDRIVKEIKKRFKKLDGCFLVVNGGADITLDEINELARKIGVISKYSVLGTRIDKHLKGRVELGLYAGWRR